MCVSDVRSVHGSSRSRFVWRSTTLRQTAVLCLSDSDHAANQIFQNQVWVGRRCLVLFVREKSDQKPCKRRQAEINQRPSPTPSTARCTAATGLCGTPTSDVRHAMCERSVPMLIRWMVMHTTMYQRFNISISINTATAVVLYPSRLWYCNTTINVRVRRVCTRSSSRSTQDIRSINRYRPVYRTHYSCNQLSFLPE